MLHLLLLLAQQQVAPPDAALYKKARAQMADILAHQPDYTCVQTIDRSEQAKPKAKYEVIDSLRFEVAFVDKRELYAWPGSKKFDDTSILDMVPDGAAIATGAFAGHAQYLFRSDIATVKIADWATDKGRQLARYPFTVPITRSRYVLMKSKKESSTIGYSGDIWVDPSTARVTRITLHADAIPAKLEIQATSTIIEYGTARIGDRDFWLPSRSVEEITTPAGRTDRNITIFSGCRAFTGASTLRFDDGPAEETIAAPLQTIELPAGLWFELRFDEMASSLKTHVGDLIPATLATDIKHKGSVLFAKGSEVELRLIRILRVRDSVEMEFAMGEVKSKTATARLLAMPDPTSRPRSTVQPGSPLVYGDPLRPGIGSFTTRGTHMMVRKGFRSVWVTTLPVPANTVK